MRTDGEEPKLPVRAASEQRPDAHPAINHGAKRLRRYLADLPTALLEVFSAHGISLEIHVQQPVSDQLLELLQQVSTTTTPGARPKLAEASVSAFWMQTAVIHGQIGAICIQNAISRRG